MDYTDHPGPVEERVSRKTHVPVGIWCVLLPCARVECFTTSYVLPVTSCSA